MDSHLENLVVEEDESREGDDSQNEDPRPVDVGRVDPVGPEVCDVEAGPPDLDLGAEVGVELEAFGPRDLGLEELGAVRQQGEDEDGKYVVQEPSTHRRRVVHRLKCEMPILRNEIRKGISVLASRSPSNIQEGLFALHYLHD